MTYFSAQIRSHGRVIPNPVALPDEAAVITERADRKKIVSVGSLRKVKGHDLLIDAFALIANQNPAWDLEIYGEGGERHNLESQIERLGLKDRVSLCGHVASPISKLRMADLFALPSRAEGFPNALAEAMACGLPVVSFDCRSGPSDLIRPGIDGLLVAPGDVAAFAAALASLIKDPNQRIQFGSRAPEVLERFGLVRILALWEELLHGASTKPC
jgi:glycosyltransferase involved in cell wall biosynthesis